MKVLVTGATGYIGGRLVPELVAAGHSVRVMVRDPRRIEYRPWRRQVEVVAGGLEDDSATKAALRDMDAAYYLVHSMAGRGNFAALDRELAERFARAAAGISHVVYLGGLVPTGGPSSRHLQSREEVGSILRRQLPTTEFRAGPVIGSGSASFEMVRYLTERLPVMIAPRWIENPVRPIAIRDVLAYLVAALERGPSGVMDIGTEPLTFREMMLLYAEVRGLRRRILPVPVLAPRLAALWVGLVTPLPNRMAVPLIEGIVNPLQGDAARARGLFPEITPLEYREAVRQALEETRSGAVSTRWSGAGAPPPEESGDVSQGVARNVQIVHSDAPPEAVHRVVTSLGGDRGWLRWNWAWRVRGLVDRLLGGPGLRRGRRHPQDVEVGESVDFWRVEAVEPGRLLRLRAEMRLPGEARLQWESVPAGKGTRLIQTATFIPKGLAGTLYWWALYPVHAIMFRGLARAIARLAERGEGR